MNKLLTISILLLSLNLYGADTTLTSSGLEGWGKESGVHILIEDYSERDKTFDKKAINDQIELTLRLAGIKIKKEADYRMYIVLNPSQLQTDKLVGYSLRIQIQRHMTFKYNGKIYEKIYASTKIYDFLEQAQRDSKDTNRTPI